MLKLTYGMDPGVVPISEHVAHMPNPLVGAVSVEELLSSPYTVKNGKNAKSVSAQGVRGVPYVRFAMVT
jgi:hypothetical protein